VIDLAEDSIDFFFRNKEKQHFRLGSWEKFETTITSMLRYSCRCQIVHFIPENDLLNLLCVDRTFHAIVSNQADLREVSRTLLVSRIEDLLCWYEGYLYMYDMHGDVYEKTFFIETCVRIPDKDRFAKIVCRVIKQQFPSFSNIRCSITHVGNRCHFKCNWVFT
jgi:hypothetical protein